jgi:hypothetical protein
LIDSTPFGVIGSDVANWELGSDELPVKYFSVIMTTSPKPERLVVDNDCPGDIVIAIVVAIVFVTAPFTPGISVASLA